MQQKYNVPVKISERSTLGWLWELSIVEASHFFANLDENGLDARVSVPVS